ncbi:hypothetical protein BU17DRAFT_68098 [Hysterangium stoloniferum]|nr:hypothetical protein BU17DRAFT_68098 [Hysterangium stoloniferum]
MGMLARLSLEEACVVSKPGSSTSSSSSTIKREEGSAKLRRAATYDEDDFETESESATSEGFGIASTDCLAQGLPPTSPKGLENARCPARYSFKWVGFSIFGVDLSFSNGGIFFKYVSSFVYILNTFSTLSKAVYERDLSLFTVVLAISSRYLSSCPRLHNIVTNFPECAAAPAFIDGVKSVEMGRIGVGFMGHQWVDATLLINATAAYSPFSDGYTGVALDLENDTLQYLRRMRSALLVIVAWTTAPLCIRSDLRQTNSSALQGYARD